MEIKEFFRNAFDDMKGSAAEQIKVDGTQKHRVPSTFCINVNKTLTFVYYNRNINN